MAEENVRELARTDFGRRLAGHAAAVAGEHLGPEPRGFLVGRDGLGGQRALHELIDRSRAVGRGVRRPGPGIVAVSGREAADPGPGDRQVREGVGSQVRVRVVVRPVQRPEQAVPRFGEADLLGPLELLLAAAADGLDHAGRVGGHADRGSDGDPGHVHLHHDAVFGLAVAIFTAIASSSPNTS